MLKKKDRPYELFHQASSIEGRVMDSERWLSSDHWPKEWKEIDFKAYPRLPRIALPRGRRAALSLEAALSRRRSEREPSGRPLPLAELAGLLRSAVGFLGTRRSYPSAGARFPVECYVVALRCSGLTPGLYHYDVRGHALETLLARRLAGEMKAVFGHDWVARSRAVIVLTGVMGRSTVKYSERGYRFALLEAGHLMQNLSLGAAARRLPLAPVGGFADQPLTRLLDLGELDELPLYCAVLP